MRRRLPLLFCLTMCAVETRAQLQAPHAAKTPAAPAVTPSAKDTLPAPDPSAGRRAPGATPSANGAPRWTDAALGRAAGRGADPYATPHFARLADGTLHVATAHHKVRCDDAGFVFHARPAPGATHYDPVRFDLVTVCVGGEDLPLHTRSLEHDDHAVAIDRTGCVERIAIDARSIEQSFVFADLPRRGELQLTVRTTTALAGEDRGDGIAFVGEFTTVTYGEAIAIDAAGRRTAATTSFADGVITIRVPAEFVAHANLPLVIDPVIGGAAVFAAGERYAEPDVAWDETNGVWAMCYQYEFSPFDHDVFVQRYDGAFAPIGTAVAIDATTDDWLYPRIANNNLADTFLLVAQVSAAAASPYWISGCLYDAAGGLHAPFVIAKAGVPGHAAGDKVFPDVGGDAELLGPTYFTVVWERVWSPSDHDIHMKQVTTAGALRSVAPVLIDDSGSNDGRPTISNSCGAPPYGDQRFGIAWERTVAAGDRDAYASLTAWDGLVLAPTFALATGGTDQSAPAASTPTLGAHADRRLLFVWQDAFLGNGDVAMAACGLSGLLLASANLSQLNDPFVPANYPQGAPAVDTDGVRFAVAWLEGYQGNANDPDSRVGLVALVDGQLVVQDEPQSATASQFVAHAPRVASHFAASGTWSPYAAVVDSDEQPTRELAWLRGYEVYQSGWDVRPRPAGCGTGLAMFASGSSILGMSFTLSLSQTSGLVGVLAGDYVPAIALPPCPSCTVIVANPIFLFGSVLFVAVPLEPSLVGAELGVQGIGYGTGPCLGGFEFSNGFQVTVR